MIIANSFIKAGGAAATSRRDAPSVTLSLAQRRRSRQRLTLDGGDVQVGMAIDRGQTLRDGDILVTQDGQHIVVKAAHESVARVTATSPWQLARAAYHLGNRHILLEVADGYLQFEYDAVLVDMLHQLGGLTVEQVQAAFEPDVGAYGGGHRHGHDETFEADYALAQQAYQTYEPGVVHDHGHSHGHDHSHAHEHSHGHGHDHRQAPGHSRHRRADAGK